MYATTPIGKVVGEFEVKAVLSLDLEELWSVTGKDGGVDEDLFREYFHGKEIGFAIEVGEYKKYRRPYNIQAKHGVRPPQSFLYLDRK